ncbi:MAG: M23 family metallopeptidase [Coriobacteriia bacterium]|nr:M23 family metallopeptidase [Coriobacteriia bacterium]
MRVPRRTQVLTGGVLTAFVLQSAAWASVWCAPVTGCAIVTAYGESYAGVTHRGVDLRADAGAEASAPAAGSVTFAGCVPADGGGTCGAVTVDIGDGLRVSLLPLDEVFVTAGDQIAAGEVVGTVAATGDSSHPEPHIHIGLRRDEAYLDPTGFLPGAAAVSGGGADAPDGSASVEPLAPDTAADAGTAQPAALIVPDASSDVGYVAAAASTGAQASVGAAAARPTVSAGASPETITAVADSPAHEPDAADADRALPVSRALATRSSRIPVDAGLPQTSSLAREITASVSRWLHLPAASAPIASVTIVTAAMACAAILLHAARRLAAAGAAVR